MSDKTRLKKYFFKKLRKCKRLLDITHFVDAIPEESHDLNLEIMILADPIEQSCKLLKTLYSVIRCLKN